MFLGAKARIMGNPFDGSQTLPIRDTGKTAIIGGTIWKLEVWGPGASGWTNTEVAAVPEDTKPPATGHIPPALVEYVKNASPTDYDSVKARSAISVSITNANYNLGVFDVYTEKFVTHAKTGQGKPPAHPGPFYRLADFPTVFMLISAGIPVPVPPEYPSR
jgi:hypothetical protein